MMKKSNGLLRACKYVGSFCLLAGWLFLESCTNTDTTHDVQGMTDNANYVKSIDAKEQDAQFLIDAANINLEEVEMGKLAQNRAMNEDVKDLGKTLEGDHANAQQDLKKLAKEKQITIPETISKDANSIYKKMSAKTGKDFDKDYIDMMVKGHEGAILKFEKAAKSTEDADIRSWAISIIPNLQSHLDQALMCQKKL